MYLEADYPRCALSAACVCVCVCVFACVRARVCVCVCMYEATPPRAPRKNSCEVLSLPCLPCETMRLCGSMSDCLVKLPLAILIGKLSPNRTQVLQVTFASCLKVGTSQTAHRVQFC